MSPYLSVNPRQRLFSNVKHLLHNLRHPDTKTPQAAPKQAEATISDLEYNFKLRRIIHPKDAIELAREELAILADLLEAHFVSHYHSDLQLKAISIARELSEQFAEAQNPNHMQELITIEFDRLSQIMLQLKNYKLTTSAHILWSDIMRPSVRVVSLALQRYMRLAASMEFEPSDEASTTQEKLNITYATAQKRALAEALGEELA